MAFGQITETANVSPSFKKYIGVMPVKIVAVNPNKEELSKIYGTEVNKEPEYLSEVEYEHPTTKQVSKVKQVKLDFIVQNEDYDFISKVTFFLRNTPWISQTGKCQVIDKYGRTAWVTAEEFKNKAIPQYSNGPARIDKDYTTAVRNQEHLIKLLKYYLGVPEVDEYVNETWKEIDDPTNAEASLKDFNKLFEGDVTELRELLSLAKNNLIKVLTGVRIVDGKQYQDILTTEFMRNYSKSTKAFEKAIADLQSSNTLFEVCEAKEFTGHPNVQEQASASNPFASEEKQGESTSDLPF